MRSGLFHLQSGSSAAIRSALPVRPISVCFRLQKRFIAAKDRPLAEADKPGPGPNQDQLPHVSEEAAATGKITGEGGPDIEQGTPVQEVRPSRLGLVILVCLCSRTDRY
jgi:small subunit ribosomal protein S7